MKPLYRAIVLALHFIGFELIREYTLQKYDEWDETPLYTK